MPSAIKARAPRVARTPQLLPVEDLTGGVDLRRSQTLMAPDRARTLLNCSLEEPGALVMRPGYRQVSTAALFSGRAQGGQRVYLANSVFTVVAGGGAIYKPNDAWASTGPVFSTLSATNEIFFPYDRDIVMAMDGSNRPRMSTNGSSWMLSGITAPSSAATLSTSPGGGALSSGEYAISYTYKHRGTAHESNGSSESTITISGSTGAISATASPSTDPKVDAYVWYARHKTPDQESVLRKVSSGAASTFTFTSSNWTANDEIPTNHGVPPNGLRFGTPWKSRWWAPSGTIGNRLHFTELFLPQAWPPLFFIDIPFEKGDSITSILPLGDTLIVRGQSGAFLIVGQTALDFEVRPSQGSDAGSFGPRAVTKVEQSELHASGDGVDSFDGASDRSLDHEIQPAWRDLVTQSASTSLSLIATVYDALRQEWRVAVPRVYPTAVRGEWVLNLGRTRERDGQPAWATTDRDIHLYIHWNGNEQTAGDRGRLFSLPSTSGLVFEENVGTDGNSSNRTMTYEGPGVSMGLYRAQFPALHMEVEPHSGAFSVEPLTDGVSRGSIPLDIGAGLFPYGSTIVYGTPSRTYGGAGRLKLFTPLQMGHEGHTFVLRTTYSGRERMKIFDYAPVVVPDGIPRML